MRVSPERDELIAKVEAKYGESAVVDFYPVAQIGKNFALSEDKQISGARLIVMALDEFRAIKRRIGGKLVMIERENGCPKLQSFYHANGFKSWTRRNDAKDKVCYDQMFAVI